MAIPFERMGAACFALGCVALGCEALGCEASQARGGMQRELNMQSQANPNEPQKTSQPIAEMVGATSAPFLIGPGITQIYLTIHAPAGPALENAGLRHRQAILSFENVKGHARAPSFRVYLNLPGGAQPEKYPELRAGNLGMFGLVESSSPRENSAGDGKNMTLDISDLFARLAATKDWDKRTLRLTFVPGEWDAPVPQVQIGRMSLYFR